MFPTERFKGIKTPFYYYDTKLLRDTLQYIREQMDDNMHMHYAVKANANPTILKIIAESGMGADCVSGGEIEAAINAGFNPENIVYAGVGKSDWEIRLGLEKGIFCFNVESIPELEIISQLAAETGQTARVCLRINPNVGAHTHANIQTGLSENKFGIDMQDMESVIHRCGELSGIRFVGLHFHIGSQILQMDDFKALALRINELQDKLEKAGICEIRNINVGGGLGIDYNDPEEHPIPDFRNYIDTYRKYLKLRPGQQLHFECGRAVVGQMGSLIARVLYVKENAIKRFCILDAGMTDLIRPALYDAFHKVENISATGEDRGTKVQYDVVGPVCESSDVFVKDYEMCPTKRGDIVALRSAGAYGEIMASSYNCRPLPKAYFSQD